MSASMTGKVLNNRYLIGERIGIGGMAEVYQGQDTVLGRIVAVKVMLPQFAEDPTFTARFRQEAAAAANLQSPYIVNVYDWGTDGQTPFIIMEFIRGSDLKTAIKERGSINQRKVAEIGSQVCQALSVAHGLDIIHRDIKPQNIMVQPDGNVKVMDFGIARAKNSMMDKTDVVLGTAHYISPEQAQGKDLTPASDIYSLGVVLYEAITGQLPFDGPDAVSVAMKQVNEQPLPPSQIAPSINSDLEGIIMKAMAKNPADRFATALDMRMALNDFLGGRPVNLNGIEAASTTVIVDGATQNIGMNPTYAGKHGAKAKGDHTSVMSPTEINSSARQTVRPSNYRSTNNSPDSRGGKNASGKKRGPLIAGIAILAVVVVGLLFYALLGKGCSGPQVEVPDVTGKTFTEAKQILEDAGFELGSLDYKFDDSVEADTVIGQNPRAKSMQAEGSKISLTISRGAEQVSVPDLTNMTANEARSTLQKYGLNYEVGESVASDDVAENRVAKQSPSAGTKVDKGTTVTFALSSGKEKVEVPDVRNFYEGYATTTLQNAGFEVAVDYRDDSEVPAGQVISQSPAAGSEAPKGSKVSLLISNGAKYFIASAYVTGAAQGGSVSPTYAEVAQGKSVTFYIQTNAGYKIASVTDSNGNSYGSSTSVTINNVQSDVSISVAFEAVPASGGSSSN